MSGCSESSVSAWMTELPGLVSHAEQRTVTVVENVPLAQNTWRMRLASPEIAAQILPGQFFMIRVPHRTDPLLGRPFALYDVWLDETGQLGGIDFGYVVVGKMTSVLSQIKPGATVEIWGPLGNGFPLPGSGHLALVAGGIGQTPFLAVVREALKLRTYGQPARKLEHSPRRITLCYGVRSEAYLAGVSEFERAGIDVRIATDDGSAGQHGFVTQIVQQMIAGQDRPDQIYCCGPEPMMHATARLAASARIPCWLSLETPMACGFGACFSCVTKIRQDDGTWDYRRVCVEGPVFPAEQLAWEAK